MSQKLNELKNNNPLIEWLSLFSSFGTILCCALPSTLVLLGFGSTLASFLSSYPQLVWLSENKILLFSASFGSLGISFILQYISRNKPCPIDQKDVCTKVKRNSRIILWASLTINLVGAFYAFILPLI